MTEMRRRPVEVTDAPEHRSIPIDSFALEDDGDTLVLRGYASTFQPYEMYGGPSNGYGWIERIAEGAFERTLKEGPDLHLLINHEGLPLARTKSDNLDLSVDGGGLRVVARLDRTDPDVQRLEAKMRPRPGARPLMDEMSFAFRVKSQTWESTAEFPADPEALRTINEVSLHKGDVSVVNFGANPTTSVSLDRAIKAIADCDKRELAELRDGVRESTVRQALEALEGLAGKPEKDERAEGVEGPTGTVIDDLIEILGVGGGSGGTLDATRSYSGDEVASLIKALDATLDEAVKLSGNADRQTLPENVAQALDLVLAAQTIAGKLMEATNTFDPDAPDADRADDADSETREDAAEAAEDTSEEPADERSEGSDDITIPVVADITGITGVFARMQEQMQSLVDGLARALAGAGADEQPTEEAPADEATDEERDEAPKGMSLRELRVLEGIVPEDGPLTLAELRALES